MIYWEFHISLYLTFTSIEKHSITKISMKMWIIFAGLRSGGQCLIKYKFSLFVVMMQQHWTNLIGIFDKMSCMMWIQCWLMHLFRIWPHEKFYLLVCQPIYLFTAITLFWPYASYKSFWFIHWVIFISIYIESMPFTLKKNCYCVIQPKKMAHHRWNWKWTSTIKWKRLLSR